MPEGDTIFRTARTLNRVLAGTVVTGFTTTFPALARVAEDRPIVGRTIESASSRGKHVLIAFSGALVLRTHMRMNGSWHTYPAGARWKRSRRDMRVLIETANAVAVGFNIPVAEFLTATQLARSAVLNALGPDLLGDAFDRGEALRRIRRRADEPIGDVLLNQRVLAGIGNVFKSEVLFLAAIDPFTPASSLSDVRLEKLLDIARDELRANVLAPSQTLSPASGRRTLRSLNPNEKLWVYGRSGKPCRQCGAPIQSLATGFDARLTYWCPRCQHAGPEAA